MFTDLSSIIDLLIFVLSSFVVISTVSAIFILIWTLARHKENPPSDSLNNISVSNKQTEKKRSDKDFVSHMEQKRILLEAARSIIEDSGLQITDPRKKLSQNPSNGLPKKSVAVKPLIPNTGSTLNNNPAFLLLKTGNVHLKHGDFASAIKDYSDALILNPVYAGAYNARGMANRKMKNFQSAIEDYNAALKLHNNLAAAYNNRGVIYLEIRQFIAALSDFDKALSIEPSSSFGYCNRAVAYNYMRDFNKSISESTRAVEINPQLPEAYVVRGIAKVQIGANGAADLDFEVAESLGYKRSDINDRLHSIKQA